MHTCALGTLYCLFPTSLCGVLVFSSASARLPRSSPPSHLRQNNLTHSHTHISHPHTSHLSLSSSHLILTHALLVRVHPPSRRRCYCELQSRCVARARWGHCFCDSHSRCVMRARWGRRCYCGLQPMPCHVLSCPVLSRRVTSRRVVLCPLM